jgi:hypothetical protein
MALQVCYRTQLNRRNNFLLVTPAIGGSGVSGVWFPLALALVAAAANRNVTPIMKQQESPPCFFSLLYLSLCISFSLLVSFLSHSEWEDLSKTSLAA